MDFDSCILRKQTEVFDMTTLWFEFDEWTKQLLITCNTQDYT